MTLITNIIETAIGSVVAVTPQRAIFSLGSPQWKLCHDRLAGLVSP